MVFNWVAVMCATALAAAGSPADRKDPRETYSTDGWKLAWSEEFNGSGAPDRAVWQPEVGFIRNHEPQYYTDMREENCTQKDGALVITARKETWPNADYLKQKSGWKYSVKEAKYTSADIISKRSFLYGRIEVRAQMPGGHGAWPAIWTLGDCLRKPKDDPDYWNWPCCGEIDIVEIWGNNPFRKPHFLLLNLALGGYGNKVVDEDWTDPKTGKVVPAAKFPMEMKIDYVRYYTKGE